MFILATNIWPHRKLMNKNIARELPVNNTLQVKIIGIIKIFFMFLKKKSLLCSSRLHLYDEKYSNTVKYYYNLNIL